MFKISKIQRSQSKDPQRQKGQVLIIVIFAMVALIAFIGLVVDLGLVFIQYGRLRRSVDAAALAASSQIRKGYTINSLERAANEFLILNDINDPSATIDTCDTDITLCDTNHNGIIEDAERRKFVRVVASSEVQLAFLPVLGIRTAHMTASAVSEAASVDLALVLDRSESMAYNYDNSSSSKDPSQCDAVPNGNWAGDCSPFSSVRQAAYDFIDNLFLKDAQNPIGYDRVAVITFDRHAQVNLDLTSDKLAIQNAIHHLTVYAVSSTGVGYNTDGSCNLVNGYPSYSPPVAGGPCRLYDDTTHDYLIFDCPLYHVSGGDPSSCGTTNIGGGLLYAGNEFATYFRESSLWVTILLTDGVANSSIDITNAHPYGFCPSSTHTQPFCSDGYAATRHCADADHKDRCITEGADGKGGGTTTWNPAHYDADDFARDMADFVALDQNSLIFTIGFGSLVNDANNGGPPHDRDLGEKLLEYVSYVGKGSYYFAPNGNQLHQIFASIADKIATRLTQ